jgi:hypothetical protein
MRVRTRLLTAVVATASLSAVVPAAADASILISTPQTVECGDAIQMGVWNRPDGQRASSRVKIQVRSARGYVLASRTVTARSSWRYWYYTPRCGRTYKVTFVNPQFGSSTQRVRVGS